MKLQSSLSTVAALILAGGMSAAMAQSSAAGADPSDHGPVTTTPASPQGATGDLGAAPENGRMQGGAMQKDEAAAADAARVSCQTAASPQLQDECMARAQQDWQNSMRKGNRGDAVPSDGMTAPDSGSSPSDSPSGSGSSSSISPDSSGSSSGSMSSGSAGSSGSSSGSTGSSGSSGSSSGSPSGSTTPPPR